MNFFAQQEHARKLTFRLIFALIVAVLCLILITTIVVAAFIYFIQGGATSVSAVQSLNTSLVGHIVRLIGSEYFLWIATAVCAVVFCGSAYKHLSLRQGGEKIALSLGGLPINLESTDLSERKLINVVEEMAIASGTPMPAIYVLPEDGINAFAAGNNPQAAVIGVTRGCINHLSRDELQGVIAHEFSHIHNGDMRLNLKLVAILHGILLIGLIGHTILRGSFYSGSSRVGSSRNGKKGNTAILGLALVAVGYGGTFFGNVIKAAVSRQREFLADASAVQFTRNPLGIGSALNKIARHHKRSIIENAHASEFSHMYFARGVVQSFSSLFSTHPETELRIKRIFPKGVPSFPDFVPHESAQSPANSENTSTTDNETPPPKKSAIDLDITGNQTADAIILTSIADAIAISGDVHESSASSQKALKGIPNALIEASHNAFSSRAIIYGLVLDNEPNLQNQQLILLKKNAHPRTSQFFHKIKKEIFALKQSEKMPLMELCLPSLNGLSESQDKQFKKTLRKLIEADKKISLFEWCVYQRIMNHNENSAAPSKSLEELATPISLLLTCVSTLTKKQKQQDAFLSGYHTIWPEELKNGDELPWVSEMNIQLKDWSSSLKEIRTLRLLSRPILLKALAATIEHDHTVTEDEIACFRLIASTLDCPIPTFSISS